MVVDHKEGAFEAAIEASLLEDGGYVKGDATEFAPNLALTPSTLVTFLKDTQPDSWAKLQTIYGTDVETKVVQTIAKNLDQRNTLDVLPLVRAAVSIIGATRGWSGDLFGDHQRRACKLNADGPFFCLSPHHPSIS